MPLFPETYVIGWPALLQLLWTVVHWKGSMHMLQDPVMIERAWSRSVLFLKRSSICRIQYIFHRNMNKTKKRFIVFHQRNVDGEFPFSSQIPSYHPKDQPARNFSSCHVFQMNQTDLLPQNRYFCLFKDFWYHLMRSTVSSREWRIILLPFYIKGAEYIFRISTDAFWAAWIAIINKSWFLVIVSLKLHTLQSFVNIYSQRIIPAPTVSLVDSSTRMTLPVFRLRR